MRIRISKISLFLDDVKTLEITLMFQWCGMNFLLHISMGVGRGHKFVNFSKVLPQFCDMLFIKKYCPILRHAFHYCPNSATKYCPKFCDIVLPQFCDKILPQFCGKVLPQFCDMLFIKRFTLTMYVILIVLLKLI